MIRQVLVMSALNLLSLPQRLGSALIDVFGVACVVAVFVGLFSVVASYQSLLVTGSDDATLLVMKSGNAENESQITQAEAAALATAATAADPRVILSPESSRLISVKRPQNHDFVTVALRGVGPHALGLRDGMKLTAGRMFQSGRYELIVGHASQQQFAGLQIGGTLHLADADWRIVGIFTSSATGVESEVWGDLGALQSAYGSGSAVSSVRLLPSSDAAAANIRARLKADPNLGLTVQRERDYFQGSINGLFMTMRFFAYPVLLVMAIGAVFAGLNTMYGAVAARTREIGVARSMGFGAAPVALGVLFESVLLSLLGGILGVAVIRLALNGMQTNTNFFGDTQFALNLVVPPALMLQGVVWAALIGFLGGLLPAVRAGRLPIVEALRET
ncbi:MAG TPA: ABC transporter permease [Steroidobacteraceae bacterium]|jgi:putative ABC transport system permease protein|nr:ABC transporter permease [Steroidobacteraceae bacterium]